MYCAAIAYSLEMVSHGPLQTLKENLWPGYVQVDVRSLFISDINVEREAKISTLQVLAKCFLFLDSDHRKAFVSAIESCPPLRYFINLKLFEAQTKPDIKLVDYQIDLCKKFIALNEALSIQRENDTPTTKTISKERFDELCETVVDVLDPSVFSDRGRFPETVSAVLSSGSAKTSSWWGCLGATAAVSTAAAVAAAKYGTSSYTWTVANVVDVVPILPLAFGALREGRQSITPAKMIATMLTAATQMSCSARGVHSGAWGSYLYRGTGIVTPPPTLPFNCVPVMASLLLRQPKVSTLGLFVANTHLTVQDYVNVPSISDLPVGDYTKTIERLLDIFTDRTKSVGYLAEVEDVWSEVRGFSDLKKNFILPFLMDPVQVSNKFLSTFSSIENGRYSEIAENLAPSIKAYFQNVTGRGENSSTANSVFVIKHDSEYNAKHLNDLDLVVASKLGRGHSSLVTYIDGPKNFYQLPDIVYNIRHFINTMQDMSITWTVKNLMELNKLLPQEDFLSSHDVKTKLISASDVLLFSMFQVRNPKLRKNSEMFFNQTLHSNALGYSSMYTKHMDLVVKLSTSIDDQSFFGPTTCKKMMGVYDHTLFYKEFLNPIINDARRKYKSIGASVDLTGYEFSSSIAKAFKEYPLIQTKLVQELALKTQGQTFSEKSRSQILKTLYLIDNPHIDESDLTGIAKGLLSIDDAYRGDQSLQSRGQHWRMMQMFAILRSQTGVMDASVIGVKATKSELEYKFNAFYEDLYKHDITCMFPAATQTVFLNIWKGADFSSTDGMSYNFLREMYEQNKSIFWLPILGLVVQEKKIPPDYWKIAKEIKISDTDAASYFDFLCRWVYPLSYNTDQKSKLLAFSRVLSEKFTGLSKKSFYLKNRLLVDDM